MKIIYMIFLISLIVFVAGCGGETEVKETISNPEEAEKQTQEIAEKTTEEAATEEVEKEDLKTCSNNAEMTTDECEDSATCVLEAWTCEEGDCPDGLYGYKCIVEEVETTEDENPGNETTENTELEAADTFITDPECVDGVISATFNNILTSEIVLEEDILIYTAGVLNKKYTCDKDTIEVGKAVRCTDLGLIAYTGQRLVVINYPGGKDSFVAECGE